MGAGLLKLTQQEQAIAHEETPRENLLAEKFEPLFAEISRAARDHLKDLKQFDVAPDVELEDALKYSEGEWMFPVSHPKEKSISRSLEILYLHISELAIGYSRFQALCLSYKNQAWANLAERHLADWTPLLNSLAEAIPRAVVFELMEGDSRIESQTAERASEISRSAWARSLTSVT